MSTTHSSRESGQVTIGITSVICVSWVGGELLSTRGPAIEGVGEGLAASSVKRVLLALAAYRRELLVDPGVHLRSVETAREADLPRKMLPCLHAEPLLA